MNDEAVVGLLETEWDALHGLYSELGAQEWDVQTELPGWTVRDLLSHVIGTESALLGHRPPQVDTGSAAHVKNKVGELNEPWIVARRQVASGDLLSEFRSVTRQRLAALEAMSTADFDADSWTPAGPGTYRDFMRIRVFDCWMHEQDARRVLDRPGNLSGPVVEQSLDQCVGALGFVVGKKAGVPAGTNVVFEIAGEPPRAVPVAVAETPEGKTRASILADVPRRPTVRLGFDVETFVALCGGRWIADEAVTRGRVAIRGDEILAGTIIANMAFVI